MKNKNTSTGVAFGLIIGLVYCLLVFWRWQSASNIIMFGIIAIVSYLIIIGILFYEASYRKKLEGGYIDLKNLFQTLFVSVLIFEFFFALFNFIYIKYVDPDVIQKMKSGMEAMLDKAGDRVSDEQRKDSLSKLDKLNEATQIGKVFINYLTSVAVSGVIAFLISLIMRKRKPVFEEIS